MSLNQKDMESSVKGISDKCEEMFKDAEEYGTIILHDQVILVKEALKELNEEFDAHGPGTIKLSLLKETAERRAVTLEYYLQAVCEKYRGVYETRVYAEEFIRKVMGQVQRIATLHNDEESDKVLWSTYGRFALGLKRRSLRIVFELSADDRAMIDEISKNF